MIKSLLRADMSNFTFLAAEVPTVHEAAVGKDAEVVRE